MNSCLRFKASFSAPIAQVARSRPNCVCRSEPRAERSAEYDPRPLHPTSGHLLPIRTGGQGGFGRHFCRSDDGPEARPAQPWLTWPGLLLLVFLCGCQSTGEPLLVDMTPQQIVFRHAETAFAVALDAANEEDRRALEQFQHTIPNASNRKDLQVAWTAVPRLAAHGTDFLESRVFERAARDADWPIDAQPVDERLVYVEAVRMAIESFLAGEDEEDR